MVSISLEAPNSCGKEAGSHGKGASSERGKAALQASRPLRDMRRRFFAAREALSAADGRPSTRDGRFLVSREASSNVDGRPHARDERFIPMRKALSTRTGVRPRETGGLS